MQQQVEYRLTNERLNYSETYAVEKHGAELVEAALQAATQAREVDRFIVARDPYGEMIKWYKRQQAANEIGDDLEAYKAKLRAEWEAEHNGSAAPTPQSASQQPPAAPVPKSLARTPSAQPRDQSTGRWTGPTPLSDILDT